MAQSSSFIVWLGKHASSLYFTHTLKLLFVTWTSMLNKKIIQSPYDFSPWCDATYSTLHNLLSSFIYHTRSHIPVPSTCTTLSFSANIYKTPGHTDPPIHPSIRNNTPHTSISHMVHIPTPLRIHIITSYPPSTAQP